MDVSLKPELYEERQYSANVLSAAKLGFLEYLTARNPQLP